MKFHVELSTADSDSDVVDGGYTKFYNNWIKNEEEEKRRKSKGN